MINPQRLDLKSLPWLPLYEKAIFPTRSAIYFAIDNQGNVQYIGRTQNVRHRWAKHHKYDELRDIGNIKIAYLFLDAPELLLEAETALIEWFKPPLNIIDNPATHKELEQGQPRAKDVVYVRARVPKNIHLRFKIEALKAGKDMDKIINELIEKWLAEVAPDFDPEEDEREQPAKQKK